ncbi:MAG TPA: hypothetical protein VNS09_10905 [Solirubrobacter sp.]|nr:hypothetical protein [Solirubrobacter sp.]
MLVLLAFAAAWSGLTAAAHAKLKLRLAASSASVQLPASDSLGNVFDDAQRFSTACRANERAISPGIVDASRHIVGQSFGPSAVGGFAVGAPGQVRLRLQVLCASGANVTHTRVPSTTVPTSATTLRTTAKARCSGGRVSLGAPLSQEFSPGLGRFTSRPVGTGGWEVRIEGIPTTFPLDRAEPAYADIACVPTRVLKSVTTEQASTEDLHAATSASVTVKCGGGRRAVGWGVDLQPFTRSRWSSATAGWVLPLVRRATLSASAVAFTFEIPPGGSPGGANGLSPAEVAQTAYVRCGKPA